MVIPILLFMTGTILVYSAVKDIPPGEVFRNITQGKHPSTGRTDAEMKRDLKGLLAPGKESKPVPGDPLGGYTNNTDPTHRKPQDPTTGQVTSV